MASEVSIINRALIKLGEATILQRTDNLKQARTMNTLYEDTRDAELRAARWKFAIKRTQLSALVAAPDWGYSLQYPLPSDFLALVRVNDIYVMPSWKSRAPWSVESGKILTDMGAPLKVSYVSRVSDAGSFDALFVDVLACRLAMEACEAQTQSDTKYKRLVDMYRESLSIAIRMDAIENPPDQIPDGSWLASRGGSSSGYGAADDVLGSSGFSVQ